MIVVALDGLSQSYYDRPERTSANTGYMNLMLMWDAGLRYIIEHRDRERFEPEHAAEPMARAESDIMVIQQLRKMGIEEA